MAGRITVSTINDDTGVLATQNGMTGIAKAWVSFNGTNGTINGTPFNVSSVTRNAVGNYTVNMTTAMPNINYSALATTGFSTGGGYIGAIVSMFSRTTASPYTVAPTTSAFSFATVYATSTLSAALDYDYVNVAVFSS
jgi:hypothetical protein